MPFIQLLNFIIKKCKKPKNQNCRLPPNPLLTLFSTLFTNPSPDLLPRRDETILSEFVRCNLATLRTMLMCILIYEYLIIAIPYSVCTRWTETPTMGTFLRRIAKLFPAIPTPNQYFLTYLSIIFSFKRIFL